MQLPPRGGTLAGLPMPSAGAGMASKAMHGLDAGNVMADTGTRECKPVERFDLVPAVKKQRKKRKLRVQSPREPTASAEPQQPHLVAALVVLAYEGVAPASSQPAGRPAADASTKAVNLMLAGMTDVHEAIRTAGATCTVRNIRKRVQAINDKQAIAAAGVTAGAMFPAGDRSSLVGQRAIQLAVAAAAGIAAAAAKAARGRKRKTRTQAAADVGHAVGMKKHKVAAFEEAQARYFGRLEKIVAERPPPR